MTLLRMFLLSMVIWFSGFWSGYIVRKFKSPCEQIQPLKVTILDNGGADLKVESSVVPACK